MMQLSLDCFPRILRVFVPRRADFTKIVESRVDDARVVVIQGPMHACGDTMALMHGTCDGHVLTRGANIVSQHVISHVISTQYGGSIPLGTSLTLEIPGSGFDHVTYCAMTRGELVFSRDVYRSCMSAFSNIPQDVTFVHAEVCNMINPVLSFRKMQSAFLFT